MDKRSLVPKSRYFLDADIDRNLRMVSASAAELLCCLWILDFL